MRYNNNIFGCLSSTKVEKESIKTMKTNICVSVLVKGDSLSFDISLYKNISIYNHAGTLTLRSAHTENIIVSIR